MSVITRAIRIALALWSSFLWFSMLIVSVSSTSVADQQARYGDIQLAKDGSYVSISERFDRVQLLATNGNGVSLPIWTEHRDTVPGAMVTPWPLVRLLQGDSLPVSFFADPREPPRFVFWLWNEGPSDHFMAFNAQRLGLSRQGYLSILQWGVSSQGVPSKRSICHWWSEWSSGKYQGDFLLVDQTQANDSVGCVAAGLLRHVGNSLWSHMNQQFGGSPNSEVLAEVKRLYECALHSQFRFINTNPTIATDEGKEQFLFALDQRLRHDCLPKI